MLPAMLASTLDPVDFAEVSTPAWAMERKWDGHRLLVTTGPAGPAAFNREGVGRALPAPLGQVFAGLENEATFDGEWANGRFYVFDMPVYDDIVDPSMPWARRQIALRKLFDLWSPSGSVDLVPHVRESAAKINLLATIQEEGGEGVVFKHLASRYEPGHKSPAWRKHKFLNQVDVVVIGTGHEGKNNLVLAVADPAGVAILPGGIRGREIGRCSALTGDGPAIQVGDVVTVTVTGIGPSGRLVEPVTPRRRTDKEPAACGADQLDEIRTISR